MLIAEDKGPKLHDGDEAGKEIDLGIGVSSVDDTREGEQLRTLVDLGPEPVLEALLRIFERRGFSNQVEMGEEAENFGEPVGLQDIQELESFLHVRYEHSNRRS